MPAPSNYNYTNSHMVNLHMHAGTGGIHIPQLNLNEDVSGTSSVSSSSRRNIDQCHTKLNRAMMQSFMQSLPVASSRFRQEECAELEEGGQNPETENKKEQQDCDKQTQERPPLQTLQDQESDQHSSGAHSEQMLEIQRVIELTRHLQRSQLLKKE